MKFSAFKRAAGRVTACLAVISALAACGGGDDGTPVVTTTSGQVVGNEESSLNAYLGIPYAAAPTGDRRWRAPAAPASWSGVRATRSFGSHCPQGVSPFGVATGTSEDCLYLNVYTPKTPGPHPVMVWIHGGAFTYGQSDGYNPQRLVDQGTVVVTINYRLGALGFMSHALLTTEQGGSSGNYGLMDQQAALRWVRDNIGGFGGDSANVTIFGESAGGFSVHSHIASAGSTGLFHKAIIMSGAYALDGQDTRLAAETKGATVVGTVAALTSSAACTTTACLRAMPLSALLTAQSVAWPSGPVPSIDGSVLTQSVRARITAGTHNRVPVIQGSTKDEWRLFVAYDETLPSAYGAWRGSPLANDDTAYSTALIGTFPFLDDVDPTLPSRLISTVYPRTNYGGSTSLAMGALGTDLLFACNARVSSALQENYSTVYAYEFADQTAPSVNFGRAISFSEGAEHTSELAYIFTLADRTALTSTQLAVANTMVTHWAQFARTGNPNSTAAPTAWPAWGGGTDSVLSYNASGTTLATDAEFAAAHKCGTWTSPLALTANGAVLGTPADTMVSFQGIPYAAPPTGALRWAAPAAPANWTSPRLAMSFASHCPQSAALGTGSTTEDCLYLNVYTPSKPGPHPVMVWFPGGAFVAGTAASYVPTALVQQDMVVVTVNYRLGALGFMTHPALATEQAGNSGNYGLMDQQRALRWVRDNIANFGGSPSNVTIFGESAGGLSVQAHLASAGSTGLFHKAAVQSGAYGFVNGVQTTSAAAETRWNAIPAVAACAGDLTCLRALDVPTLLAQQGAAFATGPVPTIDGVVLTQSIYNTFRAGTHNVVPIMQGHTRDEYRYFVASSMLRGAFTPATDASTYSAWVSANVSPAAAALTALYPIAAYPNAGAAAGALGTDAVFTCPSRNAMLELAQHGSVYAFEFRDRTAPRALPAIPGFDQGAAHATELTYLFTMAARGALNADQQALSGAMVRYWSRFARNGNPNGGTDPTWSAISGTDPVHLGLDIGTGGIAPLSNLFSSTAPAAATHFCLAYTPS